VVLTKFNSETLFKHAFQFAGIGMAIVGLDGQWLKVNAALCAIVGYSEEELIAHSFQEITYPDDLELDLQKAAQLVAGTIDSYQMEKRYIHKSGAIVWVLMNVSLVRNDREELSFFIAQIQNITERKQAEHQLNEGAQRFQSLFEQHPDLVFSLSKDGTLLQVNSKYKEITGYDVEEVTSPIELIDPGDAAKAKKHARLALQGLPQDYELSMIRKDGQAVPLRVTNVPIVVDRQVVGLYCVAKDISDYRRKTMRLRAAEELYTLISENAQDVITLSAPNGICAFVSPAIRTLLGYEPNEIIGTQVTDWWHPEDRESLSLEDIFKHAEQNTFTCRVRHKQGQYVWFETTAKQICNDDGEVIKLLGVSRDITERRQAEFEREHSEKRFRSVIQSAIDAIIVTDHQMKIATWNRGAEQIFGFTEQEMIGGALTAIIPEHLREAHRKGITRHKATGQSTIMETVVETFGRKKDGTVFPIELSLNAWKTDEGMFYSAIIRDITDRKHTHELLVQSEKLSIAGQLAAGIAHEIRNPLTAIKGFVQLMKRDSKGKRDYLHIISSELDRIGEILTELLYLSKPHTIKFEECELGHLLEQVVTLLGSQANLLNIKIATAFRPGSMMIRGDENQLKQVFINFLKNAMESMPKGGPITVELDNDEQWAHIRFIDQGFGIPEKHLAKIGEPFFTTKENGTGLGFMVSRKIIENHGGRLSVSSQVNQGTVVEVKLPMQTKGTIS
jgi:two-component system sporulation sensor kinase A